MIDASQIRAARAMLRMEQTELAKAAGVSVETIKRMEKATGIPRVQQDTLRTVKRALERAGLVFLDDDDNTPGGRGVRFRGSSILADLQDRLSHVRDVSEEIERQIENLKSEISKDDNGSRSLALSEIGSILSLALERYTDEGHSLEAAIEAEQDFTSGDFESNDQ